MASGASPDLIGARDVSFSAIAIGTPVKKRVPAPMASGRLRRNDEDEEGRPHLHGR